MRKSIRPRRLRSPSQVWLVRVKAGEASHEIAEKAGLLYLAAGLNTVVEAGDLVAVKMHFGEKGNTGFVKPEYVRSILEEIKRGGGKPFLTDTNTLYRGQRSNSVDHLEQAYEHGFTPENVGAPVIIADGILSKNYSEVPIRGKHFNSVKIANDILHADSLLVLTHVTGHMATGLGGCIKNVAMGCASKSGKQLQHADIKPKLDRGKCRACSCCAEWCPVGAIEMKEKAEIDYEKCYGCAECVATCRNGAIEISFAGSPVSVQERMVEYAMGTISSKKGKVGFMSFLLHVTKDCDCLARPQKAAVEDLGILASRDPVAVDQASADLLSSLRGADFFSSLRPNLDYTVQLEYAEEVGLGSRKYELIEI